MKKYTSILFILFCFFWRTEEGIAQCYPGKIVTAAYATGGTGLYKKDILWLTWGSIEKGDPKYGQHNQPLSKGATSYASIPLGGGTYLCVEAEIIKIDGDKIRSYAPGNFSGDFLDDLYNIGGTDSNNQLVSGVRNSTAGEESTITLKAKATIDGVPVRLSGMVVADAESLASGEYIHSTASGDWTIIEVMKNLYTQIRTDWLNRPVFGHPGPYNIKKEIHFENGISTSKRTIKFEKGNDKETGAIAFLKFNDAAYIGEDLSVEFTTTLKGGGLTALAIGLLTPTMDLGDAPESYGFPIHLLHNLDTTYDSIDLNTTTDINTGDRNNPHGTGYQPGKLIELQRKYLGSTAPDADTGPMHSIDAKGDDDSGTAGENEEDAWPVELRRFSYKTNYMPGDTISAKIKFKNGSKGDHISGWIDFDLNGLFDESEIATAKISATDIDSNGNGTVRLSWIVPNTRIPYNTYVRLRYFDAAEDYKSPTSNVNYGEVEDHRMYILTPARINPMLPSKPKLNTN